MINIFKNMGQEPALDRIVSNYANDLRKKDAVDFMKKHREFSHLAPRFVKQLYKYDIKDIIESKYLDYAASIEKNSLVKHRIIANLLTLKFLYAIIKDKEMSKYLKYLGIKFHIPNVNEDRLRIMFLLRHNESIPREIKEKFGKLIEKITKTEYEWFRPEQFVFYVPKHISQYRNLDLHFPSYYMVKYKPYKNRISTKGDKIKNISTPSPIREPGEKKTPKKSPPKKKTPKKSPPKKKTPGKKSPSQNRTSDKKLTEKSPVSEMKKQLKKMGVKNYSKLRKEQLVKKLKENGYVFQKNYTDSQLKQMCLDMSRTNLLKALKLQYDL
jgi:hypothetical protein